MTGHRHEIEAFAGPATEARTDGSSLLLVRVRMFDEGVEHPQEDVCCDVRPSEARDLALSLLAGAEHAQRLTRQAPRSPHRNARDDDQHDP